MEYHFQNNISNETKFFGRLAQQVSSVTRRLGRRFAEIRANIKAMA